MASDRRGFGLLATAAAAALALVAGSSVPARANWQYTQWGMTPTEVEIASKGAAAENKDRSLDAGDLKADLIAAYQGEQLAFAAVFLFDVKDQLKYVTLNPIDRAGCPTIRATLMANYGRAQAEDKMEGTTTVRWQDLNNNNVVIFSDLGEGNCSIQYSKLPHSHSDGRL